MNIQTFYNSTVLTLLNTLLRRYAAAIFVPTNTASGTTSVTLNTASGIIEFTTVIPAATTSSFTLNNSVLSDAGMKINPELYYLNTANGEPVLLSCYSTSTGVWVFKIKNLHASQATNSHIFIKFQLT